MSRWWRAYDEAVDDPKLILLSDRQFRVWFNLCCITSQNEGKLPVINVVAVKLRMTPDKAKHAIAELAALGLVDVTADGSSMHNWNGRQYRSDVSDPTAAKRNKAYRDRKKNRNDDRNDDRNDTVTLTSTREQNTETEAERTSLRSDADASSDPRTKLFREGLSKLAMLTGKGPDACRSFVGKCLKAADDNAIVVLGLIEDAERNRVADPAGWIVGCLKAKGNSNGKPTVHDAAKELSRRLSELDEPAPSGLCEQAGGSPVRLLSSR